MRRIPTLKRKSIKIYYIKLQFQYFFSLDYVIHGPWASAPPILVNTWLLVSHIFTFPEAIVIYDRSYKYMNRTHSNILVVQRVKIASCILVNVHEPHLHTKWTIADLIYCYIIPIDYRVFDVCKSIIGIFIFEIVYQIYIT